jgi:site-specific DNA-methyltransferase (adenine-specific)
MGKAWDGGDVALRPETWAAVMRVLKPGAHLLAFGGTRTWHRQACAIEDAGFDIRDSIMWIFGSGFPKAIDAAKAINQHLGKKGIVHAEGDPVKRMIPGADQNGTGSWVKDNGREYQLGAYEPATEEAAAWQGWKGALKPAHEPILVARKPMIGTMAANLLRYGTGALNIDASRVPHTGEAGSWGAGKSIGSCWQPGRLNGASEPEGAFNEAGRFPANIIHDGSDEVLDAFPVAQGQIAAARVDGAQQGNIVYGGLKHVTARPAPRGDAGSAARFFYAAKANSKDRNGSSHPTVKPISLMEYLVRLVTPPGGTVLDPFSGSGTTARAAINLGFNAVAIEREAEYVNDIVARFGIEHADYFMDCPRPHLRFSL